MNIKVTTSSTLHLYDNSIVSKEFSSSKNPAVMVFEPGRYTIIMRQSIVRNFILQHKYSKVEKCEFHFHRSG